MEYKQTTTRTRIALGCLVAGFVVAPRMARAQATQPPHPKLASLDPRVDQILTNLERRSQGLTDIRCKVRFVEDDRMNLSKRIKTGEILFLIAEPNPNFLIYFHTVQVDDILGKREWYLFDGRWLYQALERLTQITKQEWVHVGEKIDLFDLETAPFPLPFGQKKETILRNFRVTLAPPSAGDPLGTDHLVCLPKPDSPLRRSYDKLELFVLRDVHLPNRIIVTKNDNTEVNTADFPDLTMKSINTGLSRKDFARPAAWRGYDLVIETLPPAGK